MDNGNYYAPVCSKCWAIPCTCWSKQYYPVYPNQGWTCPKCGRCYSPSTGMCAFCIGAPTTYKITCGTFPNITGTVTNKEVPSTYTNSVKGESCSCDCTKEPCK